MNIRDLNENERMTLERIVGELIKSKNELNQFMLKKGIDKNLLLAYVGYKELEVDYESIQD